MKYKLIKTYPGSLKLNTVIEIDSEQETGYYSENTQFWQPVIEKDYEILATFGNNDSLERTIFSVKRLSDGEIFTISDIVKCEDCKGKIISLEIYDNDIYLTGIDNKMPFGYTLCKALDCFEIPQKVKQKLFTTEDGVDIFENTNFVGVSDNLNIYNCRTQSQVVLNNSPNWKYFSTKEKAEEYILLNKPCLSINEINILKNIVFANWDKTLKDLVKSKIKQSV